MTSLAAIAEAEVSPVAQYANHAELYRRMLTVRMLEERLLELCKDGLVGDLHFNRGQEAIAVGVCAALQPTDHIVTHHRTIAHQIARAAPLEPLIAELLGKKTGCNGGRAGEMHISNREIRHDFAFQLVGTCIPVAVGLAWALKYHHKTDEIVTVFFGDATSSNGQFHEGSTIAALKKVPLLMICENNHLAGNITPEYYLPTKTVRERMAAYGIESMGIDGNNVLHVMSWAEMAADRVRRTGRPYLLEMDTERLCLHKIGQGDVRSKEHLTELAERDPLKLSEEQLGPSFPKQKLVDTIGAALDLYIGRVLAEGPPEMNNA
jgi:TPP-dependent pyruvate/acetoin dehydrogenase alpha subunit